MTSLDPESLSKELQSALKAGDKTRLSVIRLLSTSIRNAEVDKKRKLTEEEALEVVAREVKRRKEAAAEYRKGDRHERAEAEESEAAILETWLPEQLSPDRLRDLVDDTIRETGASGAGDMGNVMGALIPKIKGRADARSVSAMVREKLGG